MLSGRCFITVNCRELELLQLNNSGKGNSGKGVLRLLAARELHANTRHL